VGCLSLCHFATSSGETTRKGSQKVSDFDLEDPGTRMKRDICSPVSDHKTLDLSAQPVPDSLYSMLTRIHLASSSNHAAHDGRTIHEMLSVGENHCSILFSRRKQAGRWGLIWQTSSYSYIQFYEMDMTRLFLELACYYLPVSHPLAFLTTLHRTANAAIACGSSLIWYPPSIKNLAARRETFKTLPGKC
jgi:hypothetical protein